MKRAYPAWWDYVVPALVVGIVIGSLVFVFIKWWPG